MNKTDLYNKFKQEYYQLDIEAIQARIYALEDNHEGLRHDWIETAERKDREAQGVFNAMMHILPNWSKYDVNEDTLELVGKLGEKRSELARLQQQLQKEAA